MVEAGDADQALGVLNKTPAIDLLFTDVVLPGPGNGRVLATKAAPKISGPAGALHHRLYPQRHRASGTARPDVDLLNKPYTQQDLARKVRELLDG